MVERAMEKSDRRQQRDAWVTQGVDPLLSKMVEAMVIEKPENSRAWMKAFLDEGEEGGGEEQVGVAIRENGDRPCRPSDSEEVAGERKEEADTEDQEDVSDLNTLLLPGGELPTDVERFSVSYSRALLAGWVKQDSPCCAAASVAGAWNALMHRSRGDEGALSSESVLRVMRVVLEDQIASMTTRFEGLLGARFEPLLEAIQAELTQEGRHLGGRGPKSTVAKGPHLLRLVRSVTSRERKNPDHPSTFDRLWNLYEAEREEALQQEAEAATVMDDATQENALASVLSSDELQGDGDSETRGLDLTHGIVVRSSDREERREEPSGGVDQEFIAASAPIASSQERRCTSKRASDERLRMVTPFAAEGLPVITASPGGRCSSDGGDRVVVHPCSWSGLLGRGRGQYGGGEGKKDDEENEEEAGGSAGGSGTYSMAGLKGEASRRRGEARWRWKKDLVDLLKRIGGLDKLCASSPSTGAFGNYGVISTVRYLDNDSADRDIPQITANLLMGKGKAPSFRLPVALSERDGEEQKAEQWAALREAFLVDAQVLIFHLSNHYALIFALREWRYTDSPCTSSLIGSEYALGASAGQANGCWTRQILTARKGQRPTVWMDFEEARKIMLGWNGYKILVVQRGAAPSPPMPATMI